MSRDNSQQSKGAASGIFERVWQVASAQGVRTYTELARRMHTTSATISRLATGKQNWTSKMLLGAANALGVSRQWLEAGRPLEGADRVCEEPAAYATPRDIEGLVAMDMVIRGVKERVYVDPAQLRALLKEAEAEPPAQES